MLQLDESLDECEETDSTILYMIDDGDIECISNISDCCLQMTVSKMNFLKLKDQ